MTRKSLKIVKSVFGILLALPLLFVSNSVFAADDAGDESNIYEEFADETPMLTNATNDDSYPHDCTVSVFIDIEPEHERMGGFGFNISFVDDDYNTYMYNISAYEVQNAIVDGSDQIKTYFYLPKGHWNFDVCAAQGISTDDVRTVCFQSELNAEEGGVYQIHAICGTSEWAEKHQNLIPAAYRVIGPTLIDKSEVLSMNVSEDESGVIDPLTLTDEQIANLSDNVRVKFSNAWLNENMPGREFTLCGKYYKQWFTWHWEEDMAEDASKSEFNSYIKEHAGEDTKNLDVLFEQYCIDSDANVDIEIVDSTAVSAAEDVTVDITEHNPLKNIKGLGSAVIFLVALVGGFIYNRKKKKDEDVPEE